VFRAAVPVLTGAPETEPGPSGAGREVDDELMMDLLSPGLTASITVRQASSFVMHRRGCAGKDPW
jgi:hypothetical protein